MTSIKVSAPPAPPARINLAITGHREANAAFTANRKRIEIVLGEVLDIVSDAAKAERPGVEIAQTRFHSMLAEGADLMAAEQALARGWELVAPLAFGLDLNIAINARPTTADDARMIIAGGEPVDPIVKQRADNIRKMATRARLFEMADCDALIADLFVTSLKNPTHARNADLFAAESSLRVEQAARVMIEQSDLLIAIWDGVTRAFVGGTGHSVQLALKIGAPVVWIDANAPDNWRILFNPEALASVHSPLAPNAKRTAELRTLIGAALSPAPGRRADGSQGEHSKRVQGPEAFNRERWRSKSNPLMHGYRRIEALFGADSWKGRFNSLRQTYETPDAYTTGSAASMIAQARALPGRDDAFVDALEAINIRRFAWADGISAYLSDSYRGGMTLNFLLAPLAIVVSILYLPLASSHEKWMYAALELALLASILAITVTGQRHRWHARWFETRRVAEYTRHAPIMLMLGVARAPSHWPKGAETSWPEWYASRSMREPGLPRTRITQAYLREALRNLLDQRVVQQRDYHVYKAKRLAAAHHNLDKLSEFLFTLAVISVAVYLVLKLGGAQHWWSKDYAEKTSYLFTVLGVALPTLGGSVAGIRYFGDFERFSSISEVTSEKLGEIHTRITQLLDNPETPLGYGEVADLVREFDEVVVDEIKSWQAVFAGKHVSVPV